MSSVTKVVFPIPPPTTNDLSSHQRTQLLRKAKKLEQIFGATPRLVDDTLELSDPIHISFPRRPSQRRVTKTGGESIHSTSSTSSASSCGSPSSPEKRAPSVSCNSHCMRTINSDRSRASPSPVNSINSFETWPGKAKGQVMRLIMKTPTLEMIPASPLPNDLSSPTSPLQSPIDCSSDVLFTQFTHIPNEDPCLRNSIILNSDNTTSLNSLRKQKMDRLRRKLGQDVPSNLVFPPDAHFGLNITSDLFPDTGEKCCPLLPPPALHGKKSPGRISTARDSIAEFTSVHRAKRQASISRPTPTHNRSGSALAKPREFSQRLSFIIESLDEHGIGCAEEFGQSRKPGKFKSEWTVSAGGAEVKLWSTRSGYQGWRPESPSKASQMPPMSSPPPSRPSSAESKKKPSSYRKPVPPISDDCY